MTVIGRYDARSYVSRRTFLGFVAALPLTVLDRPRQSLTAQGPDSLANPGPSGKLWDPSRAGRPLEPVTARDNAAAIQVIEKRLRCTCGCNLDVYTCRTTDFTCETSPAMHARVMALETQGLSGQQIVDAFVAENGVSILMAPPKHGFNLAAYFTPSIVILVAAGLLILALRRWTRRPAPQPVSATPAVAASPEELERLNQELRSFSD